MNSTSEMSLSAQLGEYLACDTGQIALPILVAAAVSSLPSNTVDMFARPEDTIQIRVFKRSINSNDLKKVGLLVKNGFPRIAIALSAAVGYVAENFVRETPKNEANQLQDDNPWWRPFADLPMGIGLNMLSGVISRAISARFNHSKAVEAAVDAACMLPLSLVGYALDPTAPPLTLLRVATLFGSNFAMTGFSPLLQKKTLGFCQGFKRDGVERFNPMQLALVSGLASQVIPSSFAYSLEYAVGLEQNPERSFSEGLLHRVSGDVHAMSIFGFTAPLTKPSHKPVVYQPKNRVANLEHLPERIPLDGKNLPQGVTCVSKEVNGVQRQFAVVDEGGQRYQFAIEPQPDGTGILYRNAYWKLQEEDVASFHWLHPVKGEDGVTRDIEEVMSAARARPAPRAKRNSPVEPVSEKEAIDFFIRGVESARQQTFNRAERSRIRAVLREKNPSAVENCAELQRYLLAFKAARPTFFRDEQTGQLRTSVHVTTLYGSSKPPVPIKDQLKTERPPSKRQAFTQKSVASVSGDKLTDLIIHADTRHALKETAKEDMYLAGLVHDPSRAWTDKGLFIPNEWAKVTRAVEHQARVLSSHTYVSRGLRAPVPMKLSGQNISPIVSVKVAWKHEEIPHPETYLTQPHSIKGRASKLSYDAIGDESDLIFMDPTRSKKIRKTLKRDMDRIQTEIFSEALALSAFEAKRRRHRGQISLTRLAECYAMRTYFPDLARIKETNAAKAQEIVTNNANIMQLCVQKLFKIKDHFGIGIRNQTGQDISSLDDLKKYSPDEVVISFPQNSHLAGLGERLNEWLVCLNSSDIQLKAWWALTRAPDGVATAGQRITRKAGPIVAKGIGGVLEGARAIFDDDALSGSHRFNRALPSRISNPEARLQSLREIDDVLLSFEA